MSVILRVELSAYRAETASPPGARATARRLLTASGSVLAGPAARLRPTAPGTTVMRHVAVTGYGIAHGTVMAACDGARPLVEDHGLVSVDAVPAEARCTRFACTALWPAAAPTT